MAINVLILENLVEDYGYTELLKNIFGEEFLMMESTRFSYLLTKDYDDHVNNELWGTSHNYSQNFVESCIESNGELIGEFITKDHYENEIREIDKTRFLSDEEKNQLTLNMMMMMKIMRGPMTQTIVI